MSASSASSLALSTSSPSTSSVRDSTFILKEIGFLKGHYISATRSISTASASTVKVDVEIQKLFRFVSEHVGQPGEVPFPSLGRLRHMLYDINVILRHSVITNKYAVFQAIAEDLFQAKIDKDYRNRVANIDDVYVTFKNQLYAAENRMGRGIWPTFERDGEDSEQVKFISDGGIVSEPRRELEIVSSASTNSTTPHNAVAFDLPPSPVPPSSSAPPTHVYVKESPLHSASNRRRMGVENFNCDCSCLNRSRLAMITGLFIALIGTQPAILLGGLLFAAGIAYEIASWIRRNPRMLSS